MVGTPIWNRILRVLDAASRIQLLVALGSSTVVATVVTRLLDGLDWFGQPYLTLLAFGLFLLLLAMFLTLLPRVWFPRATIGDQYGTGLALVGVDEELDRRIFYRVPRLKAECLDVAGGLSRFIEKHRPNYPQLRPATPGNPTEDERAEHGREVSAFEARVARLYDTTWKSRVARAFEQARTLFYGPVPAAYHDREFSYRRVQTVQQMDWIVAILERLGERLPANYTETTHRYHIESLRRLRADGLTLAEDMGEWLRNREKQVTEELAAVAEEAATKTDRAHDVMWYAQGRVRDETNTDFVATFGGRLKTVWERFDSHGLRDDHLNRAFAWPHGALSSYDIPGVVAAVGALAQTIPYE